MVVNPRYVFQLIIKVFEQIDVPGNLSVDFLWMMIVLQICYRQDGNPLVKGVTCNRATHNMHKSNAFKMSRREWGLLEVYAYGDHTASP